MILWVFGAERVRSTVYNWVHKADLQPENERSPDHVAVDETVIRLNDEQYWLYAVTRSLWLLVAPREHALVTAVDPETNDMDIGIASNVSFTR